MFINLELIFPMNVNYILKPSSNIATAIEKRSGSFVELRMYLKIL